MKGTMGVAGIRDWLRVLDVIDAPPHLVFERGAHQPGQVSGSHWGSDNHQLRFGPSSSEGLIFWTLSSGIS